MSEDPFIAAAAEAFDLESPGSTGPCGPSSLIGDNREPCPDVSACCHARLRAPSTMEILKEGHQMRCCGCGKAV